MYENIINSQHFREIMGSLDLMTEEGKPLSKFMEESNLQGKFEGKIEGKFEGRLEGRLEAKLEIAKNLLADGFDIKKVADLTKLPIEQISKIIVNC